ncbi:DUF6522 family protein [Virgifigura deserti]|uniref:DUF6522 family protein n=1 Tax=Virgifigura deserti TaxID=2268457 RepID=UPI003CCC345D
MSSPTASASESREFVVDAVAIAPRLGLTPERFMEELRRGLVFQVTETGVGEDAGRIRLTFRYRAREFSMILNADGVDRKAP